MLFHFAKRTASSNEESKMTDLTKINESQKHGSSLGVSELIAASAVVFLLIAVQGMYVAKHPVTLNATATAELAPFGIAGP
jgi:hypothetical protein